MINEFDPELDIDGNGMTNGRRAERAAAAVVEWLDEDKPDTKEDGAIDYETHMQDLLCDLQHLAHREGLKFGEILAMSLGCFLEESGQLEEGHK